MTRLTPVERLLRAIEESSVQKTLTDTSDALGALWHHEVDSRRSKRGLPDVITPVGRVLWLIECKKELEHLKPEQVAWGEALKQCTEVRYRVVRPSTLSEVIDEIVTASNLIKVVK